MSSLSQFVGGSQPVTSIVHGTCTHSHPFPNSTFRGLYFPAELALSGAVTADVLKNALTISGKGFLDLSGLIVNDATSRTVRMKVILDGVTVLDKTTPALTTLNHGVLAVGTMPAISTSTFPIPTPCYFAQSCVVDFASSLTETDSLTVFYAYRLVA